ncbi:MAG: hypothetical protein IKG56_01185 [Clostridia bacterium]|nr:hypothetical protein [Clostridia bacterium]
MKKDKNRSNDNNIYNYSKSKRTKKETKINKKISKKRDRTNIYAIVALLALVAMIIIVVKSILYLIKMPTETAYVSEGTISKEETDIGYIIRDEVVVKGNNYKNGMEQIIDEGQKVAKDEPIFRYYSDGEDNVKEKISQLDTEIEDAISKSDDDLFSSDIKLLDSQISEKLYELDDLNDIQKLQESKKNIDGFISKKAEIAGDLSPKGSHLKELIGQRNELQSSLTKESEYINAPRSGILSYRVDGLEETLIIDDFSKYTKKFLSDLDLKTGQIISTNAEKGKVVSNFDCYLVCTSISEEAKKAEIGDRVSIVLPSSNTVKATVYYINKENDNETTLTLRFENGIEELLNYRKISFDIIWWNSTGYKIPNDAIITQNNLNYVIKNKMGYYEKILVKIVKQTDNYTIVENYSTSEIKELNIDSNVRTSILLNDEILLNPTEEQIDSTS